VVATVQTSAGVVLLLCSRTLPRRRKYYPRKMLLAGLSALVTLGKGIFVASEVVAGICVALDATNLVWRGLKTISARKALKGDARKEKKGRANRFRKPAIKPRDSLRSIWKKKSGLKKRLGDLKSVKLPQGKKVFINRKQDHLKPVGNEGGATKKENVVKNLIGSLKGDLTHDSVKKDYPSEYPSTSAVLYQTTTNKSASSSDPNPKGGIDNCDIMECVNKEAKDLCQAEIQNEDLVKDCNEVQIDIDNEWANDADNEWKSDAADELNVKYECTNEAFDEWVNDAADELNIEDEWTKLCF